MDWNEYQSKVSEIQEEKPRKYRVFYSGTKNPESLMARINAQLRNRMYSHGAIDGYISKKMEESS